MSLINILTSLGLIDQSKLDAKNYFRTLAEMKDLGTNNNKAFTYYEGMSAFCLETFEKYYWKEVEVNEIGILDEDFVYPLGSISNGIDYSERNFNFILEEAADVFIKLTDDTIYLDTITTEGNYKFDIPSELPYGEPSSKLKFNNDNNDCSELTNSGSKYLSMRVYKNSTTMVAPKIIQELYDSNSNRIWVRSYGPDPFGTYYWSPWLSLFNIQPDWDQNNSSAFDYIKNKPTISGGEYNVQSDWNNDDPSSDAYIQNKPEIPTNTDTQADWDVDDNNNPAFINNKPTIPTNELRKIVKGIGVWDMSSDTNILVDVYNELQNEDISKIIDIEVIIYGDGLDLANGNAKIIKASNALDIQLTASIGGSNSAYVSIEHRFMDTAGLTDTGQNRGIITILLLP